jgi:protein-disulfide isomerase
MMAHPTGTFSSVIHTRFEEDGFMSKSSRAMLTPPVGAQDHVRGESSAAVTLLMYGDYQCPFTQAAHPVVKDLQRHFGPRLQFAFRHFPLTRKHPHAQRAAEAAEAAAGQGKFWEMHDQLIERIWALDTDSLFRAAEGLGLDTARFSRELTQHTHADRVRRDVQSGTDSGVSGTPTFFLNGIRSAEEDEDDFDTLKAKVEAALKFATAAEGTSRN